jgi:acetylornithine deacetylase/succinyl-diaminopimelate desuccinylase family protein
MIFPDKFQIMVLRELIEINTVNPPGGEAAAAEYLAALLSPLGFETEIQTIAPGRANLIASLHCGDGPVAALSGHLDVVAADAELWQSDPFTLSLRDGRFYGRGTADMKGGISAMVAAAREAAEHRRELRGVLQLLFVADEEVNTAGTLAFLAAGGRPGWVVIGEPTGLDVCVAHRGVIRYSLRFMGQGGHAGRPEKTRNPLYDASRFVLEVERQNLSLAEAKHSLLPPPTIAVTLFEGGRQSNSIPGSCTVTVDRRTLPGEDKHQILREMDSLLATAGLQPGDARVFVDVPAGSPVPEGRIGDRCAAILIEMGIKSRLRDFDACGDLFAFTRSGVDCVIAGPGSLSQAHGTDEFVDAGELALAREFYRRLIFAELKGG